MKYVVKTARYLLALIFIVFGLNAFFLFIPVPELHPFMEMMLGSGFLYVVKVLEVLGGLLLLSDKTIRAGLVILTPIIINIALYHLLFDPRNWFIAPVNLILLSILIYDQREAFEAFFSSET